MSTFILLITLTVSAVFNIHQPEVFETGLYLVISPDSCTVQNGNHSVVNSEGTLCLRQLPVLTVHDFEACSADSTRLDGKEAYTLNIKLKHSVTENFKEFTKQHVGEQIAMLISQKVVMSAVIRDPVTFGRLTISGEEKSIINNWEYKILKNMDSN